MVSIETLGWNYDQKDKPLHLVQLETPGTPNNQFFYGCFNWMIPNHYIKNGCFTKHPLKNGSLGYQAIVL